MYHCHVSFLCILLEFFNITRLFDTIFLIIFLDLIRFIVNGSVRKELRLKRLKANLYSYTLHMLCKIMRFNYDQPHCLNHQYYIRLLTGPSLLVYMKLVKKKYEKYVKYRKKGF